MKRMSLLIAAAAFAATAFGASIDTTSGVAWQCISVTSLGGPGTSCPSTPGPVSYLGSTALGAWNAPTGGAQWTGPNSTSAPTSNSAAWPLAGTYVYYLDFASLGSGFNNISALTIGSDNGITVELCTSTSSCGTTLYSNPNGLVGFTIPYATTTAQSLGGATGIRVTVVNAPLGADGASPSGFFIDGDVTGVPEPSTMVMLSLGGAAILFARLRRKA